jgi:hypothetical protein
MKKLVFSLTLLFVTGAAMAQTKATRVNPAPVANTPASPAAAAQPAAPASSLKIEEMAFKYNLHDFGTIQEGPIAEYDFEFTNQGKEPIIINDASASCGCTKPSFPKEPILPGKNGIIKVQYNTQGRVAPFTKTITISSNAGTKVLTIKGEVEKAPTGSVPENSSLIKTN